jgi:hypothetical protein
MWSQDRMTIIYYPLTIIFLLGGLYYFFKSLKNINLKWIYPVFLISVLITTSYHAKSKTSPNIAILKQNIAGNDLAGLTPDWENFIKMCRWTDKNLPKDAVIASRKPSISYIYTGRKYAGIFNCPNAVLEDVINDYNSSNLTDSVFVALPMLQSGGINSYIHFYFISQNNNNGGFVINGQAIRNVMLCKVKREEFVSRIAPLLDEEKINYTVDIENFIGQIKNYDSYQIVNPETLLGIIKSQNIKYLLLPKIRVHTGYNSGVYVTTIHQYVAYISIKYPGSFPLIHTIGKEETCELVEYRGK